MVTNKQLIIEPKVAKNHLAKFVKGLEHEGIQMIYSDPKNLSRTKVQTIFPSTSANYIVLEKEPTKKLKGKKIGRKFKVLSNNDIEKILDSAKKGLDFVIIEVKDWKIIPLENIIAKLHKIHTQIFAIAKHFITLFASNSIIKR